EQSSFINSFNDLQLVNPTKKKFQDTVLNEYYYGLLRIYSNALEKENSILFVIGFSFSDEHIHKLTMQVANSNPTLTIYIFSHTTSLSILYESMVSDAKNKNIKIIKPEEGELTIKSITDSLLVKLTPKDSFEVEQGEEHE
ncbi:MAG TPA: SIR2 family protein, partial [Kangiella sp.]